MSINLLIIIKQIQPMLVASHLHLEAEYQTSASCTYRKFLGIILKYIIYIQNQTSQLTVTY